MYIYETKALKGYSKNKTTLSRGCRLKIKYQCDEVVAF